MIKKLFIPIFVLFALCGVRCIAQRARYNFNSDWLVKVGDEPGAEAATYDDSEWKPVTTPYAWNEDSAFKVSIHDMPTGVAWYRKHFRLPANAAGQKVFIEFEGIRQAGDITVNGHFVGRHEDGVMAFGFDLTPFLNAVGEENVIAVKTDNRWDYKEQKTGTSYQWNNANFYANYGGISKSVWLHICGEVYQTLPLYSSLGTTGTYIWASDFDIAKHTARITAESQVRNDSQRARMLGYEVRIVALDGRTISVFHSAATELSAHETRVFSASAVVGSLHFWSWGYGYLYRVVTTVSEDGKPIDVVTTRTGFRETAFKNGMIYLNGRVIEVHGYGQRTTNEWPAVGLSVPAWMSDFSNKLMVESNADLVRWMHVTPWKQDVESLDRVGLIESMPAGDAEGESKGRQWEQRVELMRDAIVYNRNSPSILFYEAGNKGITDEHMLEMKAVRDQYDPHGGRAIGAREMLASHVAEYGGEMLYIDKSSYKPLWDHEYNRDEGARKFQDNDTPPFHEDSPIYNRNQDTFTLEDVVRWDDFYRVRPGTGSRVSSGGVNIIFSDSNTHYRGDNNYRRSGEVDAMRLPKDAYFAHQVMWDGWVDVEHPRIHIVGHWNYADGEVKDVYVVSSVEKVELRLNGHSLGYGERSDDFLFTFPKVSYAAGKLEAIGYDAQGAAVVTTKLETAGPAAAIKLTLHTAPGGLRADGQDMALVDVEIVDAQGRRCPTVLSTIHFQLDGSAEWRGGIAQGSVTKVPINVTPNDNHGLATTPPTPLLLEDNYILSKDLPVEAGINRVSLRSLPVAGEITLTASSEGLPAAVLRLSSQAVTEKNGLSTFFPATELPVNLERGPTPAGPSFISRRLSVAIESATTGANAENATQSYDDDETSAWSSATEKVTDGLPPKGATGANASDTSVDAILDQAWIEYTFKKPVQPTEMDIKLNGFRTRRYPLRITLDGKTVYEGVTPTTLGYCNLQLQPALGRHLRVALKGLPIDVVQNSSLAKAATPLKLPIDQPLGKPGKPILSVMEADIYEAAK